MDPIIIDKDTGEELWTSQQCAAYCNLSPTAWSNYKTAHRIPSPVGVILGRTALWRPADIRRWNKTRIDGAPIVRRRRQRSKYNGT
ncbi:Uncharacterised protein [Corynebacterium kutscheri]|uniref:hypothetical protein n=1 Tax=Corynebacterium kutscheri TaxID=35755 RepID=UPI000F6C0A23|nr:hypothetical protein [Corynebacterium kutscheri]VEH79389.1 Uncharacterised protein [Corynebacterium kutscheri]